MLSDLLYRLRALFRRNRVEGDLDDELAFHLEHERRKYIAAGLSPAEADRKARLALGGVELVKEECREARGTYFIESLVRDLRYAGRTLGHSPGFTAVVVLSLALGIGANTAIFRLIDAVRLRALPVKEPQQLALVQLADRTGWRGSQETGYPALTNPIWERFRDTQGAFSGVAAWGRNTFNLAPGGQVRPADGLFVSGDFFRVLGVEPLMGRVFTAAADRRGCGLPGAVISYSFWQRELGGSASVVGRKLTLNYQPVEIIGVTPAGFFGLEVGNSFDVAVPICSQQALWSEGNWLDAGTVWWLTVMGRRKPGTTLEQTNAQLRAASPAVFRETLPSNYPPVNVKDYLNFKLAASSAANGVSWLRSQYGEALVVLLVTAGLVLAIACANLANLMLARGTAREREFAVRLAVGASRGRLIRQLMAESLLLAVAGATSGLFLSGALGRFLVAFLGNQGNSLPLDLPTDGAVLAFTLVVATLTCVLFGLMPALRATRTAPGDAMKASSRGLTTSRERFGLRQALVVAQVALSVVLLVAALLFSGTLRNLLAVDAGFQQDGLLIAGLDYSRLKIPSARRVAFKNELLERIRAIPGVTGAAEAGIIPLSGGGADNGVWRDGQDPNGKWRSNFNWVSGGYIRTMGISLLAGREFNERDTTASSTVAIVNESFARRLGLGPNAVGQRFRREATPSSPERVVEIVGLVRDTKYYSLRENFVPIAFLCTAQDTQPSPFAQVMIRSTALLGDLTATVRGVIAAAHPGINLDFRPFKITIHERLLRERLMATLSGFFGFLAALIAAIGLYGVMSYLVVRRTNEIGIRMALGANRQNILALILRQAATLLVIGLATGMVLAVASVPVAAAMLFGLKPYDPGVLALAAALLAAVTAVASYLPARRAAGLQPMIALREE